MISRVLDADVEDKSRITKLTADQLVLKDPLGGETILTRKK